MERRDLTRRNDFATDSHGEFRPLPRIAVLGAGHVGRVIARVAVAAGYDVTIAASGEPERIALITQVLSPGAEPRWAADAVDDSDVVRLDSLSAGRLFEPGGPVFGVSLRRPEFELALRAEAAA
jgi:hypothetical protein